MASDLTVGDTFTFEYNSDSDDPDNLSVRQGEVLKITKRTKTVQVKEKGDDGIYLTSSYYLGDIKIKSIQQTNPVSIELNREQTIQRVTSFAYNTDFSIFNENKGVQCDTNESDHLIENCSALKRLTTGLKYYSLLNVFNSSDDTDQQIFAQFVDDIYHDIIDDYNHLDTIHGEQLHKIKEILLKTEIFKPCDIRKCKYTARHHETEEIQHNHRGRNKNKNEVRLDPSLHLFASTMDSLHFYLFHLFDTGLMVAEEENEEDDGMMIADDDYYEEKEKNTYQDAISKKYEDDEYYDDELHQLQAQYAKTLKNTNGFNRYHPKKNKKFNIVMDFDDEEVKNDTTFTDELYKHLTSTRASKSDINSLEKLIYDGDYDTDAIRFDVDLLAQSNIGQIISDQNCLKSIKQFVKSVQR